MVDSKRIENIRVVGMQKKKDHQSSNKHYEFILRVKWSNKMELTIYRPYSMFFDFQGVLCEMFKERYSITIPPVPSTKFHWILLGKLGIEKECRSMEEFCQKIVNLPSLVSQSMVVLHFFDAWGTDIRALNQQSTEIVGPSIGSPLIQSQGTSNQPQNSIATVPTTPGDEHQYRAIASFTATNPGEISFEQDSILSVIEKTERGWWFVWNERDQQGWAPATYLEHTSKENEEEDNDEWVFVDDKDHAHLYSTVVSYSAQNPDEISYEVGEEVEVIAKSNYGWWKIRHGDKIGLSPATNLKKKDEEYTNPTELMKTMSISSKSGLYAVIRKAPPRKDSIRRSGNFGNQKGISRFVYSATSFSGGKFIFQEKESDGLTSTAQKDETDSKISRKQDVNMKRAKSEETLGSYENVDTQNSKDDSIKGVKVKGIEWYTALSDFTPGKDRTDGLTLKKGDVVQLISVDVGWFYVYLKRGADVKDGWVPSRSVERNWDARSEGLKLSETTGLDIPKPRPRPRVKAREKSEDHTPPSTPPVPTRRNQTKQNLPTEPEKLSPSSSPGTERHSLTPPIVERPALTHPVTDRPLPPVGDRPAPLPPVGDRPAPLHPVGDRPAPLPPVGDRPALLPPVGERPPPIPPASDRPRLPAPTSTPVKGSDHRDVPGSNRNSSPQQDDGAIMESIYDEPEAQLRSVYDAESWFFGKTSRQQCEQMLKQAGRQQEFLIRESTRGTGSYALSVKYCYRIRHFPIETTSDGKLLIGKLKFSNLIEIVNYYKENPLFFSEHKEPITLGKSFKASNS